MTDQKSREIVYFKIPVFFMDLCLHLMVLFCLMKTMPEAYLNGLCDNEYPRTSVFSLLAISFSVAISVVSLRLHERRIKVWVVLWRAMKQTLLTYAAFIVLLALVMKVSPRTLILCQLGVTIPLIAIMHYIANKAVRMLRHLGHNTRQVVIVGTEDVAVELYRELTFGQAFNGYRIKGFFRSDDKTVLPDGAIELGCIEDFFEWIKESKPDELFCTLPLAHYEKVVDRIIKECNDRFVEFNFVPTFEGYPKRQLTVRSIGSVKYIRLREEPMNSLVAKMMKRTADIVISGLFLSTLYPLVVMFVWIGNKLTGNVGPLYFRQARTGYNGNIFYIYKFRSMKVNAEADKLQATKDDPRKTPFGDFMRRTSIDELPQFINVFLGDMSVVGPRPHMEYHTEVYSELVDDYMVRHLAKPGITGWAQINGCRGETKTVEEMENRVVHDIWYIENWSILLDIEIFFKTIWQVMPGRDEQAY